MLEYEWRNEKTGETTWSQTKPGPDWVATGKNRIDGKETPGGGDGDVPGLKPKDYVQQSGLPKWGNKFVRGMVGKYGKKAFADYWQRMQQMRRTPAQLGAMAGTQLGQYQNEIASPLTAHLGAGLAGVGGGVGARMGEMLPTAAKTAYARVMGDTNIWRNNALLSHLGDRIQQEQGFTGMLGNFMKSARRSTDPTAILRRLKMGQQ